LSSSLSLLFSFLVASGRARTVALFPFLSPLRHDLLTFHSLTVVEPFFFKGEIRVRLGRTREAETGEAAAPRANETKRTYRRLSDSSGFHYPNSWSFAFRNSSGSFSQ
jgi:hypothetical protein